LHIASVVTRGDETPEEQVEISKKGTLTALQSAKNAGTIRSFVVTSSVAAVMPTKKKHGTGTPYDESDWNDIASAQYGSYPASKVQSEKAAFKWWLDEREPFRLSTIQFPLALGPQQNKRVTTSNQVVQKFLNGDIPIAPAMAWNIIDVRDVAAAHVHVLESPKAAGDRFIVALKPEQSSFNFVEVARMLKEIYPDYPLPTMELPLFFNRLMGLVNPLFDEYNADNQEVYRRDPKGRHPGFNGNKIVKQLGFKYKHTDIRQTLKDTGDSMLALGIITEPSPARSLIPLSVVLIALVVAFRYCCGKKFKGKKE
jgi:nucleoside-diphosphate-sugar epimerase